MGQQELLALAKQGDEKAIATLINQASPQKDITAHCYRNGTYLQVVLVSDRVLEQSSCVKFIYNQLLSLGTRAIKSVLLYGRQNDQQAHLWTESFELAEPAYSPPERTQTSFRKRVNQPKSRQTQHKNRLSLLLLSCISLFLVGTWGFAAKAQIETSVAQSSKTPTPQKLSDPTPEVANKSSTSESADKSSSKENSPFFPEAVSKPITSKAGDEPSSKKSSPIFPDGFIEFSSPKSGDKSSPKENPDLFPEAVGKPSTTKPSDKSSAQQKPAPAPEASKKPSTTKPSDKSSPKQKPAPAPEGNQKPSTTKPSDKSAPKQKPAFAPEASK
ncbi:MAG TPA: hypothetical protein V6D12_19530, partial [Candidatus Obscuribacterales bacterium]